MSINFNNHFVVSIDKEGSTSSSIIMMTNNFVRKITEESSCLDNCYWQTSLGCYQELS